MFDGLFVDFIVHENVCVCSLGQSFIRLSDSHGLFEKFIAVFQEFRKDEQSVMTVIEKQQ